MFPGTGGLPEEFQSSSGPKAGCNLNNGIPMSDIFKFQSSSGPKAGCNDLQLSAGALLISFNPHPALKPDATQKLQNR